MVVVMTDRIKRYLRIFVRSALLSFILYAGWTVVQGHRARYDADHRIALAYEFVAKHGDLTTYLPCFCGCGRREGHSSLDFCFVSRRDDAGRVVARDDHAETCKVCVDVALDAARMLKDGASLLDIRRAVELEYEAERSLRTATPEPP